MSPRKHPAAVALGRRGGKITSKAKAAAARRNGKKGGRPPKETTPAEAAALGRQARQVAERFAAIVLRGER